LTVDEEKKSPMLHIQYPHKVAELPITEVRRPASDSQVRIREVVTNQATARMFQLSTEVAHSHSHSPNSKATSCTISVNSSEHKAVVAKMLVG
jgi:hypothetical protein